MVDHRELLVSLAPEKFQDNFRDLICRLWVILYVYNSKRRVKVAEFKEFCLQTYEAIFTGFNNQKRWINVSPTVHSLLAHSHELIENNECFGLGDFSESGVENCNKYLRFYRCNLARKNNQDNNLEDCLTRLWVRSDPVVRRSCPAVICTRCNCYGHHTVSCPMKVLPETSSCITEDDWYFSCLFTDK